MYSVISVEANVSELIAGQKLCAYPYYSSTSSRPAQRHHVVVGPPDAHVRLLADGRDGFTDRGKHGHGSWVVDGQQPAGRQRRSTAVWERDRRLSRSLWSATASWFSRHWHSVQGTGSVTSCWTLLFPGVLQLRVVCGSISCDPTQPDPSSDWPNPTQPNANSKIWTQPNP